MNIEFWVHGIPCIIKVTYPGNEDDAHEYQLLSRRDNSRLRWLEDRVREDPVQIQETAIQLAIDKANEYEDEHE